MSNKSVTDENSLKQCLMGYPSLASDTSTLDAFLQGVKFEEEQLVGMRYEKLLVKLTLNEFLHFLDASGIPREHFLDSQLLGCGKNYKGTKGNCTYSEGDYCYCKDGF